MPIFNVTQENYTISANLTIIGEDLLIVVTGGTNPHIGGVVTLTKNDAPYSFAFPSHDGRKHKDNYIGEHIAGIIQPCLPGSCTITTGVHVNQITKAQIAASKPMAINLGRQIQAWLTEHPVAAQKPKYYQSYENPR